MLLFLWTKIIRKWSLERFRAKFAKFFILSEYVENYLRSQTTVLNSSNELGLTVFSYVVNTSHSVVLEHANVLEADM